MAILIPQGLAYLVSSKAVIGASMRVLAIGFHDVIVLGGYLPTRGGGHPFGQLQDGHQIYKTNYTYYGATEPTTESHGDGSVKEGDCRGVWDGALHHHNGRRALGTTLLLLGQS